MRRTMVRVLLGFLCLSAARAVEAPAAPAPADTWRPTWTVGPATADVGDLARVKLSDDLLFTGAEDSRKLLERMGNVPDGSEMGIIAPKADDQDWFVILEWADVGYVKDDDKDEIDADAILKNIREGTEEANEERKERGIPALHVTGWAQPPHYDAVTHNLTWAILARSDDGEDVVNYNVRVLGRKGVMSITYVDAPSGLAAAKPAIEGIISGFEYKPGKTYAEWVPGDKVAQYGLTALVAAGAGAAAVKVGLFAALLKVLGKAWKAVVLAVVALGAGISKAWNALRGKGPARTRSGFGDGDPGAAG